MNPERYRLAVFLRFADLESALGRSPKKIALQRLRKVRSWPSCGFDNDAFVEGTREGPLPLSEKEEEFNIGVTADPVTENVIFDDPNVRRTAPIFSKNSHRKVSDVIGQSRKDKRATREMEYTSRRLSEFRALAAKREEAFQKSRSPDVQSSLQKTRNQASQLEGSLDAILETPVRYPSREIAPPASLVGANRVSRNSPIPSGYLGSRDGPLLLSEAPRCMVKLGCKRPVRHRGVCDTSGMCPNRQGGGGCCNRNVGHGGACVFVGWLCPDCGAPRGRPHLRLDCPTRIARSRNRVKG